MFKEITTGNESGQCTFKRYCKCCGEYMGTMNIYGSPSILSNNDDKHDNPDQCIQCLVRRIDELSKTVSEFASKQ